MDKRKLTCIAMSAIMLTSTVGTVTVSAQTETRTIATSVTKATDITISSMPSNYKSSIEWVWNNRMVKEGSTNRKNTIFDQIYAGNGTLNYVVRWQSNKSVTLQQRKNIAKMISNQINNWTKYLKGYDGWPYDEIKVNVVGWACADASLILDKQSDEKVYTDCINDDLSNSNSSIPSKLPVAPTEFSRFDHFEDTSYSYPGGLDKRFDMYLWGTSNFQGGAGGDWGQRVSDEYILSSDDNGENHIIEHEIGHGYGFPDFYEDADRPPSGFPTHTIMWAGDSTTITEWDSWLLRYTWSQLKKDTTRFPEIAVQDSTTTDNNTNTNESTNDTKVTKVKDGAYYRIKNVNSGQYLDVKNGKDANKTNIQQHPESGEDAQVFKAVSTGDGYFKLVSQVGSAKRVVDIEGKKSSNGTNVILYNDKNAKNQQFKFKHLGDGKFNIVTRASNGKSVIEVKNASKSKKANVQQWKENSNSCQQWILERVK